MSQFWIALSYVGLGLEAALVLVLFRNGRKEFPLFFAYTLSHVVVSLTISLVYQLTGESGLYAVVYWAFDIGLDCLAIAVIVGLIGRTVTDLPRFNRLARLGTFAVFVAVPVVIAHDVRVGFWLTGILRNLSFGAEILNFVLWMLLARKADLENRLLWVSAGLGVQVTGQVLAHTLRMLSSSSAIWAPNLLLNICLITALSIWLYAFCRAPVTAGHPGKLPHGFQPVKTSSLKPGEFPDNPSRSATFFRD